MVADTPTRPTGHTVSRPVKILVRLAGGAHAALYRLTGGKVAGRLRRSPILLLTTVGRKSGKERTVPLLYLADGDRLAIVASFGGAAWHPDWWLNLRDNPETTVRIGARSRRVRAELAAGEERARLWAGLVAMYPDYAAYQRATTREIPVIILHPLDETGA